MVRTFPFGTQSGIDPDPTLRELRESEPVCKVRMATGGEVWLITRYHDLRAVESDPRFSRGAAMRPGVPTIAPGLLVPHVLVNLDPPDHTRVRKLLSTAFTPRQVELLRPRVREIVDDLLDAVEKSGPIVDLYQALAYPLPLTVAGEMLGMPSGDKEFFQRLVITFLSGDVSREQLQQAFADLRAYAAELIATKRAQPGSDVLTAMVQAHEDGERLSEVELQENVEMIITVSQDTTANLLVNSLVTLFRHPDQMELLRQRPELIPAAVEELTRYVPTTIGSPTRVAIEDVEIGGVTIRKGDAVITVAQSANRDPEVYSDPDRLDVTRSGPPHVTLGHGPHFCLGAALARMEVAIALSSLLRRFPDLRLAIPDSELRWAPNQIMYKIEALPVTW